jgi:uncharacterized membrane protein YgaE (UPF0421/DUF939 family)
MSDLVARLRDADTTRRIGESYADTHERRQRDRNEAADEIERLRKALQHISNLSPTEPHKMQIKARAALAEEKPDDR